MDTRWKHDGHTKIAPCSEDPCKPEARQSTGGHLFRITSGAARNRVTYGTSGAANCRVTYGTPVPQIAASPT